MSTILSQNVLPTRSLASTIAPCRPVYVHLDLFGYATYRRATATAWILLLDLGTMRLTVSLSSSLRMDGMVGGGIRGEEAGRRRIELDLAVDVVVVFSRLVLQLPGNPV